MHSKERSADWSVGLGLTGDCNLRCPHCYSAPMRQRTLDLKDVLQLIARGGIDSVNFGTGESCLYPGFERVVSACTEAGIRMSLTTNGYSVRQLADRVLRQFHDIDVSFDVSREDRSSPFRVGSRDSLAGEALSRLADLGIERSIAICLMNVNFDAIPYFYDVAERYEANLRANVFKSVPGGCGDRYALDLRQFWKAVEALFTGGELLACSEPVVRGVLGIDGGSCSGCGQHSFRVHPDGKVTPCVYWPSSDVRLEQLLRGGFEVLSCSASFDSVGSIPEACKECSFLSRCNGGCAARRVLSTGLGLPDPYCPVIHRYELPSIPVKWHRHLQKSLIHASYLCTFIFAR